VELSVCDYLKNRWIQFVQYVKSVWDVYFWWIFGWWFKDMRDTVHFHQSNMIFPKIPFFTDISEGKDPAWLFDAWHMFDFLSIVCWSFTIITAMYECSKRSPFRWLIEMAIIGYICHCVFFGWWFIK
jgi:hypothetical protein